MCASNQEGLKQGKYSPEEDQKLLSLVNKYGTQSWSQIAGAMNRTTRQVRERFQNYVNPKWNRGTWTDDEDNLLVELFHEYGPHWSLMVNRLKDRSDVSIKNRWTCIVNRNVRNMGLPPEFNVQRMNTTHSIVIPVIAKHDAPVPNAADSFMAGLDMTSQSEFEDWLLNDGGAWFESTGI